MLSYERIGNRGPLLVLLHWLSGSSRTWHEVSRILASRGVRCVAIDLPGFGDANSTVGYSVGAMADAVIETVQSLRAGAEGDPWIIGGHSMGCKVAQVVARRAVDGEFGLSDLRGAFFVSASPSSQEPMDESKRKEMSEQLGESSGDAKEDHKRAEKFVDDNTGTLPLSDNFRTLAVDDLLRMNRTALRSWFDVGSKEDWSAKVAVLPIPALILAGSEEAALGPAVQREKTLPHFASGEVVELKGCGHIAPLERPFEVAEYATNFLRDLHLSLNASASKLSPEFSGLLESERVASQTRSAMEARLTAYTNWNYTPRALDPEEFRTMRALAECVVPNAGFDVAAAIEERIAEGSGDGWRFAALPADLDAWRKGLQSLDAAAERQFSVSFIALHPDQQHELLENAAAGKLGRGLLGAVHLGESADAFSAEEMKLWFEEVRGEFAKCYMAHPATMERVGFTGFADEGGFTQIRLGQREEFEQ